MANFLDTILNLITSNPQLITSILSIFTNNNTTPPTNNTPPPQPTPNYTPDNPYWSLPNYHYNQKPKYKNAQSLYSQQSQNTQSSNFYDNQYTNTSNINNPNSYSRSNPYNQYTQPTYSQNDNTNTQSTSPKIDIQQTISVLSNLISALRSNSTSPNTTSAQATNTTHTTSPNNYIHTLHPTD